MRLHISRLLPLVVLAVCIGGAAPGESASAASARGSATAARCCTVTYNAAKIHVQVTGVVAYRGTPILFSFYGPCATPAGPGLANVKSRWIPLRDIVAGYHSIKIVQRVDGKIVTTSSPKFFVKGKAQLRKPMVRITQGPQGVVTATSVVFELKATDYAKLLCRLDSGPWKQCSPLGEVRQARAWASHVQGARIRPLGEGLRRSEALFRALGVTDAGRLLPARSTR